MKKKKKKRPCIPFLWPHQWHWDGYNQADHILTVRCGQCGKYKIVKEWTPS